MILPQMPFTVTNWDELPAIEHKGDIGKATWRTITMGDIRIRIVDYTPGYIADHWCERGHIIFVLEGELVTELKDGTQFIIRQGMSYQVSNNPNAHRSSAPKGAKLFIVD